MVTLEKIVSLCKQRGIIFQGSEIYGGLANTWDYGPLGVALKNNIKQAWWKYFVQSRPNMVGLDSAIFMNPRTWEASGHLKSFTDPLMDCRKCQERFRSDHLLEKHLGTDAVVGKTLEEMGKMITDHQIVCPKCGARDFTEARMFNLMFKTHQGVTAETGAEIYLRPETAQGIFVNFKNILNTMRKKIPFGIAQIGKAFRNEITPGNFIFRTREFEQMEIEYFVQPGEEKKWHTYWKEEAMNWFIQYHINKNQLRFRDHGEKELSHYSNATADIEYKFPWGWGELAGIASRTDFDLSQHEKFSSEDLKYIDPQTNEKYIPYVIEPSFGADRTVLVFLLDAYDEETLENGEVRTVFRFHKEIAPIKVAILPLSKKEELEPLVQAVHTELKNDFTTWIDETQSIGKRYRRQDEIGTPYCVTIDFDTAQDQAVTIRDRDTMKQERVKISDLKSVLLQKFKSYN
jgi:glycyl-tRNA synthetase